MRVSTTGGALSAIALAAVLGAPALSGAQEITQNTAQSQMSSSIATVCPPINDAAAMPGAPDDSVELAAICTAMTGTAFIVRDQDGVVLTEYDDTIDLLTDMGLIDAVEDARFLNEDGSELSAEEFFAITQQIAGEEAQTAQSIVGELSAGAIAAVTARMSALRAGQGSGGIAMQFSPGVNAAVAGTSGRQTTKTDAQGLRATSSSQLSDAFLGRFGVFVTGDVDFGSKDETAEADGFDFTSPGLTVGVDYRVTDNAVVGLAFTYDHTNVEFDSTVNSASGQELDSDAFLASLYGTVAITDALYVEGLVSGGFATHDSTRRVVIDAVAGNGVGPIDRTADADYDSSQFSLLIGGGYDVQLGTATITPIGQFEYIHSSIDGATESGAGGLDLQYSDQDVDSATTQIGVQATYPISTSFGIVAPYARGLWIHEFLNDNDGAIVQYADDITSVNGAPASQFTLVTEETDRNYGVLTGGVTVTLPNGMVAFVEGGGVVGLKNFDIFSVGAGLRFTF
ncbi:MAG: autotransporter outer membrane beta-barrel domain-containing protein [Pseudomonadota bacterium]